MRVWCCGLSACLAWVAQSCAHTLERGALSEVNKPAFLARVENDSGPKSEVFGKDETYAPQLLERKLDEAEADRRLSRKMAKGISRFETSDRIRAVVVSALPRQPPWNNAVEPAAVASVFESFLVREIPPKPPDYERLKRVGADSVVEFVVRSYGMKSAEGKAWAFVEGYGRFFFIDGGRIWSRDFSLDGASLGRPPLDPFKVAKQPELFRAEMAFLLNEVGAQMAKELAPETKAPTPEEEASPASPGATPGGTGKEGSEDDL